MTVASLWKVLESSGCGVAVGETDLTVPTVPTIHCKARQQNGVTEQVHRTHKTFAVDLSIWICESLTSKRLKENNANPWLHLVFTRTVRLLKLGLKLIFVVEGKSRTRDFTNCEEDQFRKRRAGTAFWNACNECEEMLRHLGVLVVRAKAEGEALCALLNQRGIVDAVISNDGDCFAFGATVVYTRFSLENLDNRRLIRYDSNKLMAVVENSDDEDMKPNEPGTLRLSRHDIISFALLTGSDLVGSGLSKVGHRKAIRFIRKCQLDNPISVETASLDELTAWARSAKVCNDHGATDDNEKVRACCTRCSHHGTKQNHKKNGCDTCGTNPGEPCFLLTTEDRFRRSLRAKALAMFPKFDPSKVLAAYLRPNENQLPIEIVSALKSGIQMNTPNLAALINFHKVIKGVDFQNSRNYIKEAVGKLLAQQVIQQRLKQTEDIPSNINQSACRNREKPVPLKINKAFVRKEIPYYEVAWKVNATVTDNAGNNIDEFDFITYETQTSLDEKFPEIVQEFIKLEKIRKQQGDEECKKRQSFVDQIFRNVHEDEDVNNRRLGVNVKKRRDFFATNQLKSDIRQNKRLRKAKIGDDVCNLLRFVMKPYSPTNKGMHPSMAFESISPIQTVNEHCNMFCDENFINVSGGKHNRPTCALENRELFYQMGDFIIKITPIKSNQCEFPPRHIFVRIVDPTGSSLTKTN